jgi:CheY-like chemotaxis protein/ketosteroid isomerase-like protein
MNDQQHQGRGRWHALLIEQDEAYRAVTAECVQLAGCRLDQVPTAELAFAKLERQEVDLVVWGLSTAQSRSRSNLVSELRSRTEAPLVLVDGSSETGQAALDVGADQWVPKPFVPAALVGAVQAALRKSGRPGTDPENARGAGLARRSEQPAGDRGLPVLYSRETDVTLFSPSGGYERGWDQVGPKLPLIEGDVAGSTTVGMLSEHVSGNLACTVGILGRLEALPGEEDPCFVEYRVTCIYRRENGEWRIVHRHVDPLIGIRALASGLERMTG